MFTCTNIIHTNNIYVQLKINNAMLIYVFCVILIMWSYSLNRYQTCRYKGSSQSIHHVSRSGRYQLQEFSPSKWVLHPIVRLSICVYLIFKYVVCMYVPLCVVIIVIIVVYCSQCIIRHVHKPWRKNGWRSLIKY